MRTSLSQLRSRLNPGTSRCMPDQCRRSQHGISVDVPGWAILFAQTSNGCKGLLSPYPKLSNGSFQRTIIALQSHVPGTLSARVLKSQQAKFGNVSEIKMFKTFDFSVAQLRTKSSLFPSMVFCFIVLMGLGSDMIRFKIRRKQLEKMRIMTDMSEQSVQELKMPREVGHPKAVLRLPCFRHCSNFSLQLAQNEIF